MFLSREIDIKLCQNYTLIYIYENCIKAVGLNRSYSANMQTIWKRRYPTGARESQVCSLVIIILFLLSVLIDIIDNIFT